MSKVKVVLKKSAVQSELLKSPEVLDYIESLARRKAQKCGKGYTTDRHANGLTRGNVSIYAETSEAIHDNYANNTLLKEAYVKEN